MKKMYSVKIRLLPEDIDNLESILKDSEFLLHTEGEDKYLTLGLPAEENNLLDLPKLIIEKLKELNLRASEIEYRILKWRK